MDRTPNEGKMQGGELAVADTTLDWDQQCPGAPLLKSGDFREPLPMSNAELFGFRDINTGTEDNSYVDPHHQSIGAVARNGITGPVRFAVVPHFPHPLHPLNDEMPRDKGKDSASARHAQLYLESRDEDADRPASSRTTLGCFTCRIRKKKYPNTNGIGQCAACLTLQVECLGFGKKRPGWIKTHARAIRKVLKIPRTLRNPNDIRSLCPQPTAAFSENPTR